MKILKSLLAIVLLCVFFQACSDHGADAPYQPNPLSLGDLGKVSLAFSDPPQGVTEVVATISRTGFSPRVLQLTISDSTHNASGHFAEVVPGVWHLRVEARDSSHAVRYSGETDVAVVAGQIANVALQLVPGTTTGGIAIVVTWGAASNLLINGSFEQGPWVGTYLDLDSGSTAINGWVVSRGQIDIAVYWQNYHGSRSIDLNGWRRGGIKQTFPTVNGVTYRVRFALSGNPEGAPTIKTMEVNAAGSSAQFSFDVTGKTITNMGWQTRTWDFVAVGSSTTLEFNSTIIPLSIYGPAIDDVSVEEVH